ncbi:MAG: hypothetical protein VZR27_12295 [Acutalibacteraceae bacterium]|nr:hypothetical protein [Clostridia bacterium]MEE3451451.1 hypothetical protein [Acutalibacteraceae bacterium]
MNIQSTAGSFSSRSLSKVREYFKKPTMLIIAGLSAACLALQVITKMNTSMISIIISAVVVACLFLIYFSSLKGSLKPTPFFLTLQIISTLQVIVTALGAVVTLLGGLVLIMSTDTIVQAITEHPENFSGIFIGDFDLSQLDPETLNETVSNMKVGLLIGLLIVTVFLVLMVVYVACQTSFLKACKRSCKEPNLFSDGASTYGNLSIVVAILQLVLIVVAFLILNSGDTDTLDDMGVDSTQLNFQLTVPMIAYLICDAAGTFLRGSFAKGWIKFAEENRSYVATAPVTSRAADASPIATFKSTTRKSNDAIKQSQPYLYGEDDKNSTQKKKSAYIPEELQNDYPPQQFDQPMGGGMMNDPFMGDPFAQPMPPMPNGDPFAADPFAADPFAAQQPMGNPYGMPNPNDANPYNNGMM